MEPVKEVYIFLGPYGEYVDKVFGSRDLAREYLRPEMEELWKKWSENPNQWLQAQLDKGFDFVLEDSLDHNKFIVEE